MKTTALFRLATCVVGLLCSAQKYSLGQNWIQTSTADANWSSVASSADGSNLVAAAYDDEAGHLGGLFVSTNSGSTWVERSPVANRWLSVASSARGDRMVAVQGYNEGGFIYVSTNSGISWAQTTAPSNSWFAVASSADGEKLVAASFSPNGEGVIYSSTNGGDTWTPTSAPPQPWVSLASSADGNKLVAAASVTVCYGSSGRPPCKTTSAIYYSSDSGTSWAGMNTSPFSLLSTACSADGTKLAAVGLSSFTSTDSGRNWRTNSALRAVRATASADGAKLLVSSPGFIQISPDWGKTWSATIAPSNSFEGPIAVSADGSRLLLAPNRNPILALNRTLSPVLNLHFVNNSATVAWTIPTRNFVLQQTSNMTTPKWTDLASTPSLNLSTLQFEVTIASPLSGFYRLVSR